MDTGQPANGNYDMTFTLFPSSQFGAAVGPILTNLNTSVGGGHFSATLDFGAVFNGSNYWLEIAVRTNGGGTFTTLAPRQSVTPVPYAIFSANAGNAASALTAASVPAGAITGTLSTTALPSNVVINGQQGVVFNGTFSGNASGLTNLPATSLSGLNNTNWNTFLGVESGLLVTNGQNPAYGTANVGVGYQAEVEMITGNCNTAVGMQSQYSGVSGGHNTSMGHGALFSDVSGSDNIAVGAGALEAYLGDDNVAVGYLAMYQATGGPNNTAIGDSTLYNLTNGAANTALGQIALATVVNGAANTGLGLAAGFNLVNGSNNIYIGSRGSSNDNGMIYLGTPGVQTNFTFAGVGNGNGQGITNIQGANIVLAGTTNDVVTTNLLAGSPGYTNWQPFVNQGYMMYVSNDLCLSNLQGLIPNALNWIHIALRVTNASQSVTLSWAPYPPGPCPILPAGFTNSLVLTNSLGYYEISGHIYGTNWATNATWDITCPGL
jgi:hypothetical protein